MDQAAETSRPAAASAVLPRTDLLFIGGAWQPPRGQDVIAVVNPASEGVIAQLALGNAEDADSAVRAAHAAFPAYSAWPVGARAALLDRIAQVYEQHIDKMAALITAEMGAPARLSRRGQAEAGLAHLREAARVLRGYEFDESLTQAPDATLVTREAIGVCALITPWNWPMNQVACKVAPALAAGCTMVLKPSELAPLSAILFAQILDEAGVPAGVFNLVQGTGTTVGAALAAHPLVDMVSFTGSNRGGVAVAQAAAPSVKRVHQELGGKSPHILMPDADFAQAVPRALRALCLNSGQSCDAPARLLVPADRLAETEDLARTAAQSLRLAPPDDPACQMGPLASGAHFDKVQAMIAEGLAEGARLVAGGPGRPEGLAQGFYCKPTVFSGLRPGMRILDEEIFGPVLVLQAYTTLDEAMALANATPYGLAAYVTGADPVALRQMARGLRAGMVHLNGAPSDFAAPFSGYKASGNGAEWGRYGLEGYLEVKSIFGHGAPA